MAQSKPDVVRRPDGTLMRGSVLNPNGRPKREIEADALSRLAETITPELWTGMVKSMIAKALKGDVQAFRALADYYAGKPTERLELSQEENTVVTLLWGANRTDSAEDTPALPAPNGGNSE